MKYSFELSSAPDNAEGLVTDTLFDKTLKGIGKIDKLREQIVDANIKDFTTLQLLSFLRVQFFHRADLAALNSAALNTSFSLNTTPNRSFSALYYCANETICALCIKKNNRRGTGTFVGPPPK